MALAPEYILNSIFSIVTVVIYTIVGLLIMLKYFKYKNRSLLLVGVAWIIMGSAWWPSSFAFLTYLINGIGISLNVYLLIGYTLIPIGVIAFATAFTDLKFKRKQRYVVLIFIILTIIYEIYFISFLIINPNELGVLLSPVDIDFGLGMTLSLVIALIVAVIFGILIAMESIKSKDREIKLKGKFLLIAFISLLIGAAMDTILEITFISVPIIRFILITSAIEFYFGFFLPSWLKKILIKKE